MEVSISLKRRTKSHQIALPGPLSSPTASSVVMGVADGKGLGKPSAGASVTFQDTDVSCRNLRDTVRAPELMSL